MNTELKMLLAISAVTILSQSQHALGGSDLPGTLTSQVKKLVALDGASDDELGFSVSIDGGVALIGAYRDDEAALTNAGSAYVYAQDQGGPGNWGLVKKITAFDAAFTDLFGASVGISGDTIVIGAPFDDDFGNNSGAAYVYERNTGGPDNWGFVTKLPAVGIGGGDNFGDDVAIDGDTIIAGAFRDAVAGPVTGSASVFSRNVGGPNAWGHVVTLIAPDAASGAAFGDAVSLSGGVAVIGARLDDAFVTDDGSAYVFGQNVGGPGAWGFVKKLVAPDADFSHHFGIDVSVHNGVAVVGASGHNIGAGVFSNGSAYVFGQDAGGAGNWGLIRQLFATAPASNDLFGHAVSVRNGIAVIGAPRQDAIGAESGSAYQFSADTGGIGNWGFDQQLTAPDGAPSDEFGFGLAVGAVTIIGAHHDSDSGINSGSAHVFVASACQADLNGDGVVDTADLGLLLGQFGTAGPSADINGDGTVDTADLGILLGEFGSICQ